MSRLLNWRAPDNDIIFLERYNINFADLCKEAIVHKRQEVTNTIKTKKRGDIRAMANDLMMFFMGIICFAVSYVVFNFIVFVILNIGAALLMGAGLILLIKEVLFALGSE